MTIAEKKPRVLALAQRGEQPKNIATELQLHESTVRRLLRESGFSAMIVSPEERKLIEAQRNKTISA